MLMDILFMFIFIYLLLYYIIDRIVQFESERLWMYKKIKNTQSLVQLNGKNIHMITYNKIDALVQIQMVGQCSRLYVKLIFAGNIFLRCDLNYN